MHLQWNLFLEGIRWKMWRVISMRGDEDGYQPTSIPFPRMGGNTNSTPFTDNLKGDACVRKKRSLHVAIINSWWIRWDQRYGWSLSFSKITIFIKRIFMSSLPLLWKAVEQTIRQSYILLSLHLIIAIIHSFIHSLDTSGEHISGIAVTSMCI